MDDEKFTAMAQRIELARVQLQTEINTAADAGLAIRMNIHPINVVGRSESTPLIDIRVFRDISARKTAKAPSRGKAVRHSLGRGM